MAISIKQIQAFNLVVMRIAGFLEYLQQFVKLVRAYAYTEGSAQSKLPAKVQPYFTALASAVAVWTRPTSRAAPATIRSE